MLELWRLVYLVHVAVLWLVAGARGALASRHVCLWLFLFEVGLFKVLVWCCVVGTASAAGAVVARWISCSMVETLLSARGLEPVLVLRLFVDFPRSRKGVSLPVL